MQGNNIDQFIIRRIVTNPVMYEKYFFEIDSWVVREVNKTIEKKRKKNIKNICRMDK